MLNISVEFAEEGCETTAAREGSENYYHRRICLCLWLLGSLENRLNLRTFKKI